MICRLGGQPNEIMHWKRCISHLVSPQLVTDNQLHHPTSTHESPLRVSLSSAPELHLLQQKRERERHLRERHHPTCGAITTDLADLALLRVCSGLPLRCPLVPGLDGQLAGEPSPELLLPGGVALRGGRPDRTGDGERGVHRLTAHHGGLPKLGGDANHRHGAFPRGHGNKNAGVGTEK